MVQASKMELDGHCGCGFRHFPTSQRVPYRINPRRNTPKHILIKLSKIKYKEKILKATKGKATNNIQGNPNKVTR